MDYTFYPGQRAEPELDEIAGAAKSGQEDYHIEPVFPKPVKRAIPRVITATNQPRLVQPAAPGLPEPVQLPASGIPEPVQLPVSNIPEPVSPAPTSDVAEFAGYQILPAAYTSAPERSEYVYHDRVHAQHIELDAGMHDPQPVYIPDPQPVQIYTPKPQPTPIYTPESQFAPIYTPDPQPTPIFVPELQPAQVNMPEPQPVPTYMPVQKPAPVYAPEPKPTPVYIQDSKPTPVYIPDSKPTPVYIPDPKPTPVYIQDSKPTPVYIPDPKPTPVYIPDPKPVHVHIPEPQKPVQIHMPTPQPVPARASQSQAVPVQPQPQYEPQPVSHHMHHELDDDMDMPRKKHILPKILGIAVLLVVVAAAAFFLYDRWANVSPNQLVGTWVQSPPLGQWIPRLEFRADGTGTSYHFNTEHNVRRNENYFVWSIEPGNKMVNTLWPATAEISFDRSARPPRFSYRLDGYTEWRSFTLVIDP